MPHCVDCGSHFIGRGHHCKHHNPYLQNYYNISSTNEIKYRTGAHTKYSSHHRPRKPLAIGFHDSHDSLEPYHPHTSSNALALAGYDAPLPVQPATYDEYDYARRTDPMLSPANLKPLGYAFERLSANHAITQLTYAIDVNGTRSVTATANPEREQCSNCELFFPDRLRLMGHMAEFPVQCDVHGVCLRWDDVLLHADEERHDRCFVRGCTSVYRVEGGWKGSVVEGHVRGAHREREWRY